jgi:hypothetical protein
LPQANAKKAQMGKELKVSLGLSRQVSYVEYLADHEYEQPPEGMSENYLPL